MDQFIANGLCTGAVYALVALGFALIYTTSGVFHIAHGAAYTAAGYALYSFLTVLRLPFVLSVALAVLATASLGALFEVAVYRPLNATHASPAVLMISSLGLYIIVINLIATFWGNETRTFSSQGQPSVTIGDVILTRVQIAQVLASIGVGALYWTFLRKSRLGRLCRAVADDSTLASVLGIDVGLTRVVAFFIGSSLAAIGAVLVALDVGMDPYVGFSAVLAAAVACIVGGLHRFIAPALGGALLGVVQSLTVWRTSTRWESAVVFAILIVFLLFRPQGLLGMTKRIEER